MDHFFRVNLVSRIEKPQQVIYMAMHQDYAEGFVSDELAKFPSEEQCGAIIVKSLLAGNRGHFGPLEHPQIILNCGWFPHSTMQQVRTHRVGISFDVQSFRYTGYRILEVANATRSVEEVFYLRPVGNYTDRRGNRYTYSDSTRKQDLGHCLNACRRYRDRIGEGFSEEHARGMIPFDVRQHWVMSVNVRSLMHLLDLRWKADAQLEAQQLCSLIWPHFESWVPEIAEWYKLNRLNKAKLAP